MRKNNKVKRTFLHVVLPIVISVILGIFIWMNPFSGVDNAITDLLYRRLSGADPNVIIIAVDEETLGAYGAFGTWSREKCADLIELLDSDEENSPELIAFDFMFVDKGNEETDARLARAAQKSGNVITAYNLVFGDMTEISANGDIVYNPENIQLVERPYPELDEVSDSGFANVFIAKDGRVRFSQSMFKDGEVAYRSFAYAIYEDYCKRTGRTIYTPETDSNGRFEFFYSSKVGEYQAISMKRVLDGEIPVSFFKDKIVLVGGYAQGMQDSYHAAVSYDKIMYGVEIQANIFRAYMLENTAIPFSRLIHALAATVFFSLFLLIIYRQKLSVILAVSTSVLLVYLGGARALALNGYTLSAFYEMIFFVGTDIYFIGDKYVVERIHRIRYQEELKEQMWSFTEAMAAAIDARTPYNATHTKHVAEYAGLIVERINEMYRIGKEDEEFDIRRKEQVVMAALLHDVGKIVTPGEVMNKATRLGYKERYVYDRLKIIGLQNEIRHLRGEISEIEYHDIKTKVQKAVKCVDEINTISFLNAEKQAQLEEILGYTVISEGSRQPFFTEEEKDALRVVKGTLTANERLIMEGHVVMTGNILSKVHFNKYFEDVPGWAVKHHEFINGKGYPYGIGGDDLPVEVRIITVADICDALLATDRPYKVPVPKEKAFEIMYEMAERGDIERKYVDYLYDKL